MEVVIGELVVTVLIELVEVVSEVVSVIGRNVKEGKNVNMLVDEASVGNVNVKLGRNVKLGSNVKVFCGET